MRFRFRMLAALAVAAVSLAAPTAAQSLPPGFVSLFDGISLEGWRGDPAVWSVHEGAIRAATEGPLAANTFLIHEGVYRNFEIRLKYRFVNEGGNSGLQFRSGQAEGDFVLAGPQANIIPHPDECVGARCAAQRFGMHHEELGRGELVLLGEQATITRRRGSDGLRIVRTVTGRTNLQSQILKAVNRQGEWNELVVIAYERRIIQAVNGVVVADVTDNDPLSQTEGLIGLQANADRAVDFQFKDIAIKPLDSFPDLSRRFVYRGEQLAEPSVSYRILQMSAGEQRQPTEQ